MRMSYSKTHIGKKICRLRELRDMKQGALATALGVSQQTVSNIEKSMNIEANLLAQIANILAVSPKTIEKFDEDKILDFISKMDEENKTPPQNVINAQPSFNAIDKLIEIYEKNVKLYERIIEVERFKAEYLIRSSHEIAIQSLSQCLS